MAEGEANKVWLVPSDFGSALQGFTKLLGAPGEDGVFRYAVAGGAGPADTDDADEVAGGSETKTDPAIAQAVAKAEADARSTSAIAIEPPPPIQYSVETQQPLPPQGAPPSGAHRA